MTDSVKKFIENKYNFTLDKVDFKTYQELIDHCNSLYIDINLSDILSDAYNTLFKTSKYTYASIARYFKKLDYHEAILYLSLYYTNKRNFKTVIHYIKKVKDYFESHTEINDTKFLGPIEWYIKKAESGVHEAQLCLAFCYDEGICCEVDSEKALYWLTEAAESGNINAQKTISVVYLEGTRVDADYSKVEKYLSQAAEQGDVESQYKLGELYLNGDLIGQDLEKAKYLFNLASKEGYDDATKKLGVAIKKLDKFMTNQEKKINRRIKTAEQGSVLSQRNLGIMYFDGEDVEQDYEKALYWFTKAAEQDDKESQWYLGLMYECGYGTSIDYSKSIEWYKKSSEQGDQRASRNLGFLYLDGNGVEKDFNKGIEFLEKAVEQGSSIAKYHIGFAYYELKDKSLYKDKIFYWLTESANEGILISQNLLGIIYEDGEIVPKDIEKAIYWYKMAADNGYLLACNNLASIYLFGDEEKRDYKMGFKYFSKAAEQGDIDSQSKLGYIYNCGLGVKKNVKKAIYWYTLAAEEGDDFAQYNLALLLQESNKEENIEKVIYWYTLAAEQGNDKAQYNLALLLQESDHEEDLEKAIYWYTLAAEQGNKIAVNNLAMMIYAGKGTIQDKDKAIEMFKENANNNCGVSCLILASLYRDDFEGEEFLKETFYWANKAIELNMWDGYAYLGLMYLAGEYVNQDYDKAKELFEKAIDVMESEVETSDFDILYNPEVYYKLGKLYYDHYQDYDKALQYFQIAYDKGFSCEIILEKTKAKLGIIDSTNYIEELAKSSKNPGAFVVKVKRLFKDSLFDEISITQIITGLLTYYVSYSIKIDIDYSNCILPTVKALEREIRKYFVTKYSNYIEKNKDTISTELYSQITKKFKNFKLGQFKDLVGAKEKPINEVNSTKEVYNSKLNFYKGSSYRTFVMSEIMFDYVKNELFDLNKFTEENVDQEIIDYMKELCDLIDQINEDYRNPSAHDSIMNKNDAETVINWLLFSKKILFRFFEKIKA